MSENYNKKTKTSVLFLALLFLMSYSSFGTDWYVDGSVSSSGAGDAWGTAFKTLPEAVTATSGAGTDTTNNIYVAAGTYVGSSTAVVYGPTNKFIYMHGGYPAGGGTQDVVANVTIIDGENSRPVVWARNLFSIDGFTIRNGYRLNTAGSGVMSFSASNRSLTIKNCIIEDNVVAISSGSNSDLRGGGVFANACEVFIEDSTIRNNVARTSTASSGRTNSAFGGGIYAVNTITITDSTISGNAAICYDSTNGVAGGGIYTPSATAVNVTNSNITGNFTNYNDGATITKREFENVNITFNGISNSIEATTVDSGSTVTVTPGASLNVTNSIINNGTVTGDLTYNVSIADTNWHLVASPVIGAGYSDTWITNNNIASGSSFGTNRAISTYDNSSNVATAVAGSAGHWRYTQGGDTGTFGTGVGYGFLKTGTGNISFTGTMPSTVNPAITQGVNNWNMVGNSFPSNMDVAAFITANTALLTGPSQAIHVWNGSTYAPLTSGYIQPGQAFFIDAASAGNISITKAMQSHQTGVIFYKTNKTSLELSVTDGQQTRSTQIDYLDNKTKGLDPGFDIRAFDGVNSEFSLTTQLLEDYQDLGFARQALPTSEMESAIIPLGLKAIANKEITFSLNTSNLPSGVNVYLENREENTFTLLTNGNVKITPQKNIDGVGIYYIRLSSKALSTEIISLEGVSIYKMNNNTLKINGLSNVEASVKMFNILGKQVLNTSFDANGNNEISLPKLATGVYIVQLRSEQGNLNKKIVLE